MNKIHFIGIGGIGVSALARYYLANDWRVSGSDMAASALTDVLQKEGVAVFIGHDGGNVSDDAQRVVYSAAVKEGNPELVRARSLDMPLLSYAEALGELTKQYFTLAVAGSHGKSTTTALLALMMIKAGLDPTVIVGTRLKEFGDSNFRLGKSKYLVIEACEWNNSFHHYHPAIAIVTNIDREHLDTFGDLKGVIKSFSKFVDNVATDGAVIINGQDKNCLEAAKLSIAKCFKFHVSSFKAWPLKIPGRFNQLNAEAAWQAARLVGVKKKGALAAIKNYRGSWRRLEQITPTLIGFTKPYKWFVDYGHHPSEIKAVGLALREEYPGKKILLVFQPHQVQRLTSLFGDFAGSFTDYDEVLFLPTYEVAGRELAGKQKNVADLAAAVNKKRKSGAAAALKNFNEALDLLKKLADKNSVVVFMGAGSIDNEVRKYFRSKLL